MSKEAEEWVAIVTALETKLAERDKQLATLREALENVRLLAARHRTQDWSQHMLRFCKNAGVVDSVLRDDAALSAPDEGKVLVPREPTEAMLLACETSREYKFEVGSHDCNVGIPSSTCADIYRAMLAAHEREHG